MLEVEEERECVLGDLGVFDREKQRLDQELTLVRVEHVGLQRLLRRPVVGMFGVVVVHDPQDRA